MAITTTPSWMNYQVPTNTEPMTGALFEGGNWKLVPSRFLAPNSVSMGPNLEGVDYTGYLAWEEQQRQQQQQQQLYNTYQQAFQKAGDTSANYIPVQGQPPKWEDFYNQFDQAHRAQFGIGLDRPWTSDLGAVNQKALIDKQFLDALNKYNQTFGTQLQPNEQYLGPAAQPNTYTPKNNRSGGIGGVVDSAMGVLGGITDPAMKAIGSVINPIAEAGGKVMDKAANVLDPIYNVGQTLIGEQGPAVLPLIASAMGMPNPFGINAPVTSMADLPASTPILNTAPGGLYAPTAAPIVEAATMPTPTVGAPNPADTGIAGIVNQTPGLVTSAPGALSNLGTGLSNQLQTNPLGLLNTGIAAYSALTSPSPGTAGTEAQNAADPFAPYRANYAAQLSNLMTNPASVSNLPGYQTEEQAALQAAQRAMSAKGYSMSGNEILALGDIGRQQQNRYFNEQFNRLATLSGATFSPSTGATLGQQVAQNATNTRSQNITAAITGLQNILNTPTQNNPAVPSTPASAAVSPMSYVL